MLKTVKSYIREMPEISFSDFYQEYICKIQDENINVEISSIDSGELADLKNMIRQLHKNGH